jgi:RNA polymerase sigma-70 factor, ECF subfamily
MEAKMNVFPGEAELVRCAQAGEAAAFVAIYERCQPSIYTHVYYRVGDERLAEDLTSEVFVKLVAKIETFTYTGRPILAWLYTIASNLVADHHRRNGQVMHLPLDEQLHADEADLLTLTQRQLTQTRLAAALQQLTEEQRRVIVFRFVENRSNAEIAALLGKNEGAVKALQHRALAALRRLLKVEEPYETA